MGMNNIMKKKCQCPYQISDEDIGLCYAELLHCRIFPSDSHLFSTSQDPVEGVDFPYMTPLVTVNSTGQHLSE